MPIKQELKPLGQFNVPCELLACFKEMIDTWCHGWQGWFQIPVKPFLQRHSNPLRSAQVLLDSLKLKQRPWLGFLFSLQGSPLLHSSMSISQFLPVVHRSQIQLYDPGRSLHIPQLQDWPGKIRVYRTVIDITYLWPITEPATPSFQP